MTPSCRDQRRTWPFPGFLLLSQLNVGTISYRDSENSSTQISFFRAFSCNCQEFPNTGCLYRTSFDTNVPGDGVFPLSGGISIPQHIVIPPSMGERGPDGNPLPQKFQINSEITINYDGLNSSPQSDPNDPYRRRYPVGPSLVFLAVLELHANSDVYSGCECAVERLTSPRHRLVIDLLCSFLCASGTLSAFLSARTVCVIPLLNSSLLFLPASVHKALDP